MDDSSEKYSLLKDKIKEYFEKENNLDKLISVQIDKVKKLGNLGIEVKNIEYKVNRFKDVLQHKCKKCQMKMLDDLLNSRAKTPEHIKSRSYITSCDEMNKSHICNESNINKNSVISKKYNNNKSKNAISERPLTPTPEIRKKTYYNKTPIRKNNVINNNNTKHIKCQTSLSPCIKKKNESSKSPINNKNKETKNKTKQLKSIALNNIISKRTVSPLPLSSKSNNNNNPKTIPSKPSLSPSIRKSPSPSSKANNNLKERKTKTYINKPIKSTNKSPKNCSQKETKKLNTIQISSTKQNKSLLNTQNTSTLTPTKHKPNNNSDAEILLQKTRIIKKINKPLQNSTKLKSNINQTLSSNYIIESLPPTPSPIDSFLNDCNHTNNNTHTTHQGKDNQMMMDNILFQHNPNIQLSLEDEIPLSVSVKLSSQHPSIIKEESENEDIEFYNNSNINININNNITESNILIQESINLSTNKNSIDNTITTSTTLSNNKIAFMLMVESNYLPYQQNVNLILNSPFLYNELSFKPVLQFKLTQMNQCLSQLTNYINDHDISIFNKPFRYSSPTQSNLYLINKDDETYLTTKSQSKNILNLITIIYIILNENYMKIPTQNLIIHMVNTLFKKYNVDSIKMLLLYIIPQKTDISSEQMSQMRMLITENANIFSMCENNNNISKIGLYISLCIKEYYNYVNTQFNDGVTLFQIQNAIQDKETLETKINYLSNYL